MTEASLQKLTKSQVSFPKDIEELTHRLQGFHILASFFFKKNGFLAQGLKKVVNFILDNKIMLKTRIYLDEYFIPKFLCSIDERVYYWLKQCSTKASIIDTDLTLIEFTSLLNDVQLNRFTYLLPPRIAKLTSEQEGDDINKPKKREKTGNTPVMVRNHDMDSDWKLRSNETWNTIFRNKSINGPTLSANCKPCLKYHVKGVCYEDCAHKESHCKLIGDDKAKAETFIKSLRGE